jgi:hypothetical protein
MKISTTNTINGAKYDTSFYMAQPLQMMMVCKLLASYWPVEHICLI